MYNSDDGYQDADDYSRDQQKPMDSHPGSMESHPGYVEQTNNMKNSKTKNQISNIGIKVNGIQGAYARIVPRKPVHDYQRLYSQNIQLRQKIKLLEDSNMKLKTRLSMADKQKQSILMQFRNIQSFNILKDRRPSHQSLAKKNDKTHNRFAMDQNRKILHSYKDQITTLQTENGRLKKTVKYTQIKQQQIENEYLQGQIRRLKEYIQQMANNTDYDEYQRQIQKLNRQIQADKDQIRSLHLQFKKRDEQIDDCKDKMKALANRKLELQRKYARDCNNMKGQISKFRQKQKQIIMHGVDAKRQASKSAQLKSRIIDANKINKDCTQCKQKDAQISNLQKENKKMGEQYNNKIRDSQNKIQELHKNQNSQIHSKKTEQKQLLLIDSKQQVTSKLQNSLHKKQDTQLPYTNKPHIQQQQSDSYQDLYNQQQSHDKVDVLHVDMQTDRKTDDIARNKSGGSGGFGHSKQSLDAKNSQNIQNSKNNAEQQSYSDNYGDQFDENQKQQNGHNSEQQQVLFQKQPSKKKIDNQNTNANVNAVKGRPQSKKKKKKEKKDDKNTVSSKAEKILKQTVYYRLIAQRYTYQDFQRDLNQSGATQFSLQQLIGMLSNQPFFLTEQHLEMLLFKCFKKQELDQDDSLTITQFLKSMKSIIGTIELNSEEQQQKILKKIQTKIAKHSDTIAQDFTQQSDSQVISKKNFTKILKQKVKLSQKQIEQCLAESSVVSTDIAHISYYQFLQKILNPA